MRGPGRLRVGIPGLVQQVEYDTLCEAGYEGVPTWTMDHVKRLATDEGQFLVVVRGRVYDVTHWAQHHPGGIGPLYHAAGKDMTDAFVQFHPSSAYTRLDRFLVANVDVKDQRARADDPLQRDWEVFTQQIRAEGLYMTNYYYVSLEFVRSFSFLAASLILVLDIVGPCSSGTHILGAVFFGLFLQQMSFLGHDAGHNSITRDSRIDAFIGLLVGNLCTGVGIGWWKNSHNNHHIATNSIEGDGDIQHMPFLCCNPKIMEKPFFSSWYKNWHSASSFAARCLLRYQHILYYPAILGVARYNLYIQSWIHILRGNSRVPFAEAVTLMGFFLWVSAFVSLLPSSSERITFLLVSHAVAGILNLQITLSHFCMEVYSGSSYNHNDGIHGGWLWTQMRTTLALVNPPWLDWFHGGLQFQDVHHLLPRVPRHNLRAIRPRIRELCHRHRCDVSPECGFIEANIMTIRLIYSCAQKARTLTSSSNIEMINSPLLNTLCALG